MYQYHATVIRILDGDSVEMNIDLGMKIFFKSVCRLSGIDTPELNSSDPVERSAAQAAKLYLSNLLPLSLVVTINSKSLDKYGRPLVEIITPTGLNVNQEMILSGNAKSYL
jgi:micrococcal nuclease